MRLLSLFAVAILVSVVMAPELAAHHSTNEIYDETQTIEITGAVKVWRLVNPHPFLIIEVTGPDGQKEDWDVSFGASAVGPLARRGYTAETFRAGEIITARGNPAKSKEAKGLLIRGGMTREDGSEIP